MTKKKKHFLRIFTRIADIRERRYKTFFLASCNLHLGVKILHFYSGKQVILGKGFDNKAGAYPFGSARIKQAWAKKLEQ
jgi:hypothetical protein